jgi:2-methylcitrate dehydratase PrpD
MAGQSSMVGQTSTARQDPMAGQTSAAGQNPMAGQTRELAEFAAVVVPAAVLPQAQTRLMQCLLDFVGVAAAGSLHAESGAALRTVLRDLVAGGDCTVVGDPEPQPAPYAALLNGAHAHSLDFDDTHIASGLHPGAAVIPAALAIAERSDVSGSELLAALAAGYEVCCRVGAALGHGAYHRGFHPTAIAGLFGGVAAAGRVLGLDGSQIADAFGLAGSMAAGSMQYLANGAQNKRLHPGFAAHNAVLAARLAAAGIRGAAEAIEGDLGLLHGYSHEPHAELLTAGLGSDWLLTGTGIKPYPSCRLTHGTIDAALRARADLGGTVTSAATVRLAISPAAALLVGGDDPRKRAPENSVDGQFSAVFQATVALLDGKADWASYTRIADPDVRALAAAIELGTDDSLPEAGAVLSVEEAGRRSTVRIEQPSGEPGTDLSWQLVRTKYDGLTRHRFPAWVADAIADLPALTSVRSLLHDLRAPLDPLIPLTPPAPEES